MTPVIATAPGKLLIAGEYAVLDGAPAISLAVNQRARVLIETAREGLLEVITTGRQSFPFGWAADGQPVFSGEQPGPFSAMLVAALEVLQPLLPETLPPLRIEIDSSEFFTAEQVKLGLGSSAAVCVALTAALLKLAGHSADTQRLCLDVHNAFQQKLGSGVDVVTSYQGGLISYRRDSGNGITAGSLSWPHGLHMLPVWTGVAASTPELLARLNAYREQHPRQVGEALAALQETATSLAATWPRQDVQELLDQLALYARRLKDLDTQAGIGIYSEQHLLNQRKAAAIGAVYKPSGAGGGDFGLLFTDSSATLEQLAAEFNEQMLISDWSATGEGLAVTGG